MSLLVLDQVSVGFTRYDGLLRQRELPVLEALSFGVKRGELVALIGASGGGKSLLAHAIFGILPPNAVMRGRIRIEGTELTPPLLQKYRGRRMALVPQSLSHLDPMTRCRRQIAWAGERAGHKIEGDGIDRLLVRYGLDRKAADVFPHQLSGGMARRMMIAIATVGNPDLIVADEPTSGLDGDNSKKILAHLRALADTGKAVLLITHSLAEALPHADRVAVMKGGRLDTVEAATHFSGSGSSLRSPFARALWTALPQNTFSAGELKC